MNTEAENARRLAPSFKGLKPASAASSNTARSSSKKKNTRCELILRRELWRRGLRYRTDDRTVLGKPDVVFRRQKVAVFCDGDFWHGRQLKERLARLAKGHNSAYWTAKVSRNVERDAATTRQLEANGWVVLRIWESDILRDPGACAEVVVHLLGCAGREVQAGLSTTRRAL